MAFQPHVSSIETKNSFYKGDGTGRDGYILTNSGGLYKPTSLPMLSPSGSYGGRSPQYKNNRPRLDGKTFFYHSDGTGRDSYVVTNSGGFSKDFRGRKDGYIGSLRNYGKASSPLHSAYGTFDYFTWAQTQQTGNDKRGTSVKDKTVKDLVARLTIQKPKHKKGKLSSTFTDGFKTETEASAVTPRTRQYVNSYLTKSRISK